MSALTDFFTSLANKIRSKLGTSTTYTPAQAVSAIDDVYTKGVTDTKKGNAAVGDVKSGKTFTSVNGVDLTGTFAAQEKTVTAGTSAASVTPDSGKYLSKVTYNPTPSQTKSCTPSTSAQTISPDSGKLLSSVSVGAISTQTKSASPSTSAQTISADSGKYMTSVSISAISPQRSAGTAAYSSGIDSNSPYVYFPYGWWPSDGNGYQYCRMTAAQAVNACPKETITLTPSTGTVVYQPDDKLVSYVAVDAISPQRSSSGQCAGDKAWSDNNRMYFGVEYGWYPAGSFGSMSNVSERYITYASLARDIGVNGNSVRSGYTILGVTGTAQSATFTPSSSQYNSSQADMGENNTNRYVDTSVCYTNGYQVCDGQWLNRRAVYYNSASRDTDVNFTFNGLVVVFSGNCNNIDIQALFGVQTKVRYTSNNGWSVCSFRATGSCDFWIRNGEADIFFITEA